MDKSEESVACYMEALRRGDREAAFFGLIEAEHTVVPRLIQAFQEERDPELRAALVKIIWQHRQPETLGFLASALREPDERIWQEALDGIVALGGEKAVAVLEQARAAADFSTGDGRRFVEWIDEALVQIREKRVPERGAGAR